MTVQNRRFIIIPLSITLLLLIPFIAMQFTSEVNWTPIDFLVMGVLLFAAGLTGEFVLSVVKNKKHRIMLLLAILATLLLIWAELAVGIFGTPFAGS